ncbi:pantoate--beta-alanine ligase [Rubripirellula reticaptiva]|uniref:Pantothenate synthetase n=1 Tax=Rubripirellula reticaptiva TaxID=2528013 RepID=A0A5C6ETF3_9BACT|nr:pantoate--beta-alanine ligase [Rubripirellula reticaptiva]TWU51664.1 Pantoate-beta-alanine ligase [Rubripirellula reticaptiva]
MQIIHSGDEVRQLVWSMRGRGKTVGVVPTMGALHDGHVSLVRKSVELCDHTIVTIFVNPTQFAAGEDLEKYPRTFDADCQAVKAAGAVCVFSPSITEMYPDGCSTFVDPPAVALPLEGISRPEHFRGVTTIVAKLFNLIPATHAVFGSKDYQQLKVVEAMVSDLNFGIQIVAGGIIREPDGLAMSSRNRYLSPADRASALSLSAALRGAKELARGGETDIAKLEAAMQKSLAGVDKLEYATIVDANTLQPMQTLRSPAQALIAARVGTTRLIDNERIL